MNIKIGKRKMTFIIIPDANSSVIRLRLPQMLLYAFAAVVLCFILSVIVVYALHVNTLLDNDRLESKLDGTTADFHRTLAGKDETIAQLKNEVIRLSQQAKEVKRKIEDIKKFEKAMRAISQIDPASSDADSNLSVSGKADASVGLGGAMVPASDEDIYRLSLDTKAQFMSMSKEMNDLQKNLSTAKQEILRRQKLWRITPTLWPTDSTTISSGFGYRKDPFAFKPSFHTGIDFPGAVNSPVFVTADGIVVFAGYDSTHGNNVIVDHSGGIRTRYLHLNKILVKEGDFVEKGQEIGLLGSTGRSTGPHLHYEVIKNGSRVDPAPYLKSTRRDD